MSKVLLLADNDISVDGISFKRLCNTFKASLKEHYGSDSPTLAKIQDIVSVGLGYANYHELRISAAAAAEALKPAIDPFEKMREDLAASLEKSAQWVKKVCPQKLLERRSCMWIEAALKVTSNSLSLMINRPNVRKANITLIVGQDSGLVLKAISNCSRDPRYFSLTHGVTLDDVYRDVEQQITRNQESMKRAAADPGHQCIAGMAESPVTRSAFEQLILISELDPGLRLAINIDRADLLKFTAPDLSAPHFHYLTIVDLDRIDRSLVPVSASDWKPSEYLQPTYSLWVNQQTRHETLWPGLKYNPPENVAG